MQETWIKLFRKLLVSPVFDNPSVLKVWIWALLKANHQEQQTVIGYQTITLHPGEFVYGRFTAADELKMKPGTVRNCLAMLANLGNLDIKSTNKFSIVYIKRWTMYQGNGQQIENKLKTKCQQIATDNNGKNVKNIYSDKNKIVDKVWKDGNTIQLKDCIAIRRFGEWVDSENHIKLDRSHYTELP